jgi:hypothetical protein
MNEVELNMKRTFETAVSYEVVRNKKMPSKELIGGIFDFIYHPNVLWGPQLSEHQACGCGWGPCQKKIRMVDDLFQFWDEVGVVPL